MMTDANPQNAVDQLCLAMTGGDIIVLLTLIEDGNDVNFVNNNGESPLHIATSLEKEEFVLELLRAGADPDLQNKNGQTPLHLAAARGNEAIVGLLLGTDLQIDKKTFYTEMTALHLACQNGYTDIVQMLLENGADITILDAIGQPALFYTQRQDIAKLLKEHAENLLTERRAHIVKERQRRRDLLWMRPPPPYKSSVVHRQKFSKRHQKLMELNVFDRLTRRKSQLP